MDIVPIRMKLLGLPIELWSLEVFQAIGNSLGDFYEADMSYEDSSLFTIAQILVFIDIWEGLAPEMVLQKGNNSFTQILDHCGVPFKCNCCHVYGHVVKHCK
jgi:hypothetical protein